MFRVSIAGRRTPLSERLRMNEYEATSALDESSPDRDAELQDYFDHLNTAFSELTDMYLSRVKGNPLLPSLESLLIDPFPLR